MVQIFMALLLNALDATIKGALEHGLSLRD